MFRIALGSMRGDRHICRPVMVSIAIFAIALYASYTFSQILLYMLPPLATFALLLSTALCECGTIECYRNGIWLSIGPSIQTIIVIWLSLAGRTGFVHLYMGYCSFSILVILWMIPALASYALGICTCQRDLILDARKTIGRLGVRSK